MNQYYGPNAFNSQRIPPQAPRPERGFMRQLIKRNARHLGFQRAGLAVCCSALRDLKTAVSQGTQYNVWSDQAFTVTCADTRLWKKLHYLGYMALLGVIIVLLALLIEVALLVGGYITHSQGGCLLIQTLLLYIWLPCLAFWLFIKLFSWGILNFHGTVRSRRIFSLQRTSGMVQLFDKKDRLYFEAPFVEFDALLTNPHDQDTFDRYELILIHRYSPQDHVISLSEAMTQDLDPREHMRLWCMVQRYMDTSQSMPDILPLEAARLKDPVTIAYDHDNHRAECFWRDLSDKHYKQVLYDSQYTSDSRYDLGQDIDIFAGYLSPEFSLKPEP